MGVTEGTRGYGLRMRAVSRVYQTAGGVAVTGLHDVDLDIDSGSVLALTGPSGSGKSTLLHLIGAMDRPDSGSIFADDLELTAVSKGALISYRRTIGFVFQHFALLPALTALDNVMLPVMPYHVDYDASDRARGLLAEVGLAGREYAIPSQLSGGERQRVAIARALMGAPRLLIADEPTGNLDTTTGREIMDLLLAQREQRGITIVLGTHDSRLAHDCDTTVELRDGYFTSELENSHNADVGGRS